MEGIGLIDKKTKRHWAKNIKWEKNIFLSFQKNNFLHPLIKKWTQNGKTQISPGPNYPQNKKNKQSPKEEKGFTSTEIKRVSVDCSNQNIKEVYASIQIQ